MQLKCPPVASIIIIINTLYSSLLPLCKCEALSFKVKTRGDVLQYLDGLLKSLT